MAVSHINPGKLLWSGEHWVIMLKMSTQSLFSARLSLYNTHFSPAGEGVIAYLITHSQPQKNICFTDNVELLPFFEQHMESPPSDAQIQPATFTRSGKAMDAPIWQISSSGGVIQAKWWNVEPVVIVDSFRPNHPDYDFFTLLFFAQNALLTINEQILPGEVYPREIWADTIGGTRSSCVFALAETKIKAPKTI